MIEILSIKDESQIPVASDTFDDPLALGKYAWHSLYPRVKELAYQIDRDPQEVVTAIQDWLNAFK